MFLVINSIIGTFAVDTITLATHGDPITASDILQNHLNHIQTWPKKWRFKINETKSVEVIFNLRKEQCPQVQLNNIQIPQSLSTK